MEHEVLELNNYNYGRHQVKTSLFTGQPVWWEATFCDGISTRSVKRCVVEWSTIEKSDILQYNLLDLPWWQKNFEIIESCQLMQLIVQIQWVGIHWKHSSFYLLDNPRIFNLQTLLLYIVIGIYYIFIDITV